MAVFMVHCRPLQTDYREIVATGNFGKLFPLTQRQTE